MQGTQPTQNYSGNQAAPAPRERDKTEMEVLCARFGGSLGRLRDMNGVLRARLDSFKPEPSQIGASLPAQPTPPEPQPGSAAALHYQTDRFQEELNMLDTLIVRVQAIL